MRHRLGDENSAAEDKLPPQADDGSGVGVNYADAYFGAMKTILDDGRKVLCKRRGLKVTFHVGDKRGEALMRRLEHGPDEKTIVQTALHSAVANAGAQLIVEDGVLYLEVDD